MKESVPYQMKESVPAHRIVGRSPALRVRGKSHPLFYTVPLVEHSFFPPGGGEWLLWVRMEVNNLWMLETLPIKSIHWGIRRSMCPALLFYGGRTISSTETQPN